jgi:hypothetical protein
MPAPNLSLGAALLLGALTMLGCARDVSVHLQGAEIGRAERGDPRERRGTVIETTDGTPVNVDVASVLEWTGDADGVRVKLAPGGEPFWTVVTPRPPKTDSGRQGPAEQPPGAPIARGDRARGGLSRGPDGTLPDGTWRFRERDATPLSLAGSMLIGLSGGVFLIDTIALFFTLVGAYEGSPDEVDRAYRAEGIGFLAAVGLTVIGGTLILVGNRGFRLKHDKHLGEGRIRVPR